MSQEEKELLLKDLCSRLSCGVMIQHPDLFYPSRMVVEKLVSIDRGHINDDGVSVEFVKPYLRPMSSMTDGEKEDLRQEHIKDEKLFSECLTKAANGDSSMRGKVVPHFAVDWCNKNHFDYRGLIPVGLALEAPDGMYSIKI